MKFIWVSCKKKKGKKKNLNCGPYRLFVMINGGARQLRPRPGFRAGHFGR